MFIVNYKQSRHSSCGKVFHLWVEIFCTRSIEMPRVRSNLTSFVSSIICHYIVKFSNYFWSNNLIWRPGRFLLTSAIQYFVINNECTEASSTSVITFLTSSFVLFLEKVFIHCSIFNCLHCCKRINVFVFEKLLNVEYTES